MPKSLFLSLLVVFFGFVAVESFGEDKIQVQLHLPGETEPRHLEVTIGGVETDRVVLDLSDQNRIAISPTDSDSQIPLRSIEVRGEVAAQILSKIGTDPRAAWLFPGLSADASPRPYRLYGAGLSLSSISASGEAKAKADSMELLASPIRMDQNAILRITKQPSLALPVPKSLDGISTAAASTPAVLEAAFAQLPEAEKNAVRPIFDQRIHDYHAARRSEEIRRAVREKTVQVVTQAQGTLSGLVDAGRSMMSRLPRLRRQTTVGAEEEKPAQAAAVPTPSPAARRRPRRQTVAAATPSTPQSPAPVIAEGTGSNRGLRNSRAISVLLAVGTALWGADQWAHRPENADKPVAQYVQAAEQETGAVISGLVGVCQRTYDSMR